MPSYRELLAQVKGEIEEVDARTANEELTGAAPPLLIDVRELDEYEQGAIPGAVHVPRGFLESRIENVARDRSRRSSSPASPAPARRSPPRPCRTSATSTSARSPAASRAGSRTATTWAEPELLDADQRSRYSRHLLIPEVGEEGQLKLLTSKVLLLGAGGLGSPAALYLAAAGVGTIGIVDVDVVDDVNLQRQVLHATERIGVRKVESARRR